MSTKPTWDKRSSGDGSKYRGYAYALADTWDDSCSECEQVGAHRLDPVTVDRPVDSYSATGLIRPTPIRSLRDGQRGYIAEGVFLLDPQNRQRGWVLADSFVRDAGARGRDARILRIEREAGSLRVTGSIRESRIATEDQVDEVHRGTSWIPVTCAVNTTVLPVQSLNGTYRDARAQNAALSRISTLTGVEQHLSLDFKRKAKDKDWPVVEMTRAVADALDQVGQDATWEKLRQHLVSTAPEGTLEGGTPAHLPAPGAGYWLLSAIRAVVIVGLFLIGGLGLIYLSDEAMQAALNHLLEKIPFAREANAGILRTKVVELATGWGIPESALPYAAMAPVWGFAVPGPKRPVPPPVVPDNYWKELVGAVRANRGGGPEASVEATAQPKKDAGADPQRKIADAKAALADLDKQWLDFTTATTPDGLRAYYFEMPALWRRPAAPAVTEYEAALFELRELLNALPVKAAAEDADRASRAAERALTAWSDAQQYAISIGIDDGRSVEEAAAARQLPKLLAQFLDPSTGAAQATRLRTIIEQQMRKLTTRPAAEHMDAVNAGALHLHRAPVLAAIEG
ncbi:hypothetical protein [Mycolicibacterium conceptionense]|uniref:hypothetical protein n=1 Tax=Mycolicibacterium conceptionense TaxID=451644 RepID=UPI0006628260|nr:hypothetical protein [Mycolicibacterium conceptionense]